MLRKILEKQPIVAQLIAIRDIIYESMGSSFGFFTSSHVKMCGFRF